jgi:hypothetical protein
LQPALSGPDAQILNIQKVKSNFFLRNFSIENRETSFQVYAHIRDGLVDVLSETV